MQSNQVHNRIISSSNMFSLIKSSPLGVCITDERGNSSSSTTPIARFTAIRRMN